LKERRGDKQLLKSVVKKGQRR